MKLLILFILSFNLCYSAQFSSSPKCLQKASEVALHLPETERLLEHILQEGPVRLDTKNALQDFQASWNCTSRTIKINLARHRELGSIISSIVFEMHNAKTDKHIEYLMQLVERGMISQDEFIESMERIEHQNALQASFLLTKGIRQGIYPKSAAWSQPVDFKRYFQIQKQAGHAGYYAKVFSKLSPRNKGLSRRERYLALKKMLTSNDPVAIRFATKQVHEEAALQKAMKHEEGIRVFQNLFKKSV